MGHDIDRANHPGKDDVPEESVEHWTPWSVIRAALIGFFFTRLAFLPLRLINRMWWSDGDTADPDRLTRILQLSSLAVPALVALVMVVVELQRPGPAGRNDRPEGDRGPSRWPMLWLLFGSSIPAEFLAAYLPETGRLLDQLVALVFFAGLYGAPALLIREAALRAGKGWPSRLAWSAAFGIAMPGLIDLSGFTTEDPTIPFWDDLWQPTELPALGISAYASFSFVLGHVVMSMGVPLALFDGAFPRLRGRPLLGRPLMGVLGALFLLIAGLIRWEMQGPNGTQPGVARTAVAAGLVLAALVIGLAMPARRPSVTGASPHEESPLPARPRALVLFLVGLVAQFGGDLLPSTWPGLAGLCTVAAGMTWLIVRWSGRPGWNAGSVAVLASGVMTARALIGFLTPVPLHGDTAAKYTQNVILLVLVLGVARYVARRNGQGDPDDVGHSAEPAVGA